MAWVAAAVLGAWLALTLLYVAPNGPRLLRGARVFDVLDRFVPRWTFFAPQPGTADYYAVVQTQARDGTPGAWRLAPSHDRTRRLSQVLVNLERRPNKAMIDVTVSLARDAARVGTDDLPITVPYLLLLNHLSAARREDLAWSVRFALLLREGGSDEPQLIMASDRHTLPPARDPLSHLAPALEPAC